MKQFSAMLAIFIACSQFSCKPAGKTADANADTAFAQFETRFLDAYWQQYPAQGIFVGYGKYYDKLVIPDSLSIAGNISFSGQWIDSLKMIPMDQLSNNNKISARIIQNQLESDRWYSSVFRSFAWDASQYNISGECDYLLNQPFAPLDDRLKLFSAHIRHADEYFAAALQNLREPTKEHLELGIRQNQGGLSVFGKSLTDSIHASHLSPAEKDSLEKNIARCVQAINDYISGLQKIQADSSRPFRPFAIGRDLFDAKFKYDLVIDDTPEQLYAKALRQKSFYHHEMFGIADSLWTKYYGNSARPKDSLALIQQVLNKIQLQHARPADFYDSLSGQVHRMKKFILTKDLFNFDTLHPPVIVRLMPLYARGVAIATAEFTPPYQKTGHTYFNIDDLTQYAPAAAESSLQEYNNYASQILSIHEGVPGHCLQGIYNQQQSPDVLRSVFQNGAMIEGWAVYCEGMMIENGWGDGSPEIRLVLDKWKLRELANVLLDYDVQVLATPKDSVMNLLVKECFQTSGQATEKYHRATLSQVQLCSYFAGASAILSLREAYQQKMGSQYRLKDFHEHFLRFGSSPVKYIRERMLE